MENLARHWSDRDYINHQDILVENAQEIFDEVNGKIKEELESADMKYFQIGNPKGEVPTNVIGYSHHWRFDRAWYYWVAKGPGIPPDIAEEFHQKWGQQVRVEGHCGCPSPKEYCNGFAVGSYHIDTLEGLKAFNELLASIDTSEETE